MENMEKALMIWLEDQNQKRIPIDTNVIKNKALKIYEKIQNRLPSTSANKVPFTQVMVGSNDLSKDILCIV